MHKKGATYNFNPPSPVPIEHRPYSNLAPGNSQLYWVADECRQRKKTTLWLVQGRVLARILDASRIPTSPSRNDRQACCFDEGSAEGPERYVGNRILLAMGGQSSSASILSRTDAQANCLRSLLGASRGRAGGLGGPLKVESSKCQFVFPLLDPSWDRLGPLWPSWAVLGPSWGPSWAVLGRSGSPPGPSWTVGSPKSLLRPSPRRP